MIAISGEIVVELCDIRVQAGRQRRGKGIANIVKTIADGIGIGIWVLGEEGVRIRPTYVRQQRIRSGA